MHSREHHWGTQNKTQCYRSVFPLPNKGKKKILWSDGYSQDNAAQDAAEFLWCKDTLQADGQSVFYHDSHIFPPKLFSIQCQYAPKFHWCMGLSHPTCRTMHLTVFDIKQHLQTVSPAYQDPSEEQPCPLSSAESTADVPSLSPHSTYCTELALELTPKGHCY